MKIKTRFAPSSTGYLHIGSIRTALYSWLFARHHGGTFVLRIEDTDIKRSNNIYVENILKTLTWLGIDWDEGPYFQSERLKLYQDKISEMLDLGYAYKCYCSIDRLKKLRAKQILHGLKPSYDRKCRNNKFFLKNFSDYVIRFKNPLHGKVIFNDCIRGKITFNNKELDDLVIQRRNGMPTYNFCVVIDDLYMNITHVIRGEDHINNTPRQINILKCLKCIIPTYAHVSMVINDNKSNLSKRKNSLDILEYKKKGFFKEAILNYVLKLGWSYQNKEVFSISDMKKLFSIYKVSKSPSELNIKKLLWFNHYFLNNIPINDILMNKFIKYLSKLNITFNKDINLFKVIKLMRSRCNTIQDLVLKSRYFFEEINDLDKKLIYKYSFNQCYSILKLIYQKLYNIENWNKINIIIVFKKIAKKFGIVLHSIFMLWRIAITGSDISPSIGIIMEIIGKKNTLYRFKKILPILKSYN